MNKDKKPTLDPASGVLCLFLAVRSSEFKRKRVHEIDDANGICFLGVEVELSFFIRHISRILHIKLCVIHCSLFSFRSARYVRVKLVPRFLLALVVNIVKLYLFMLLKRSAEDPKTMTHVGCRGKKKEKMAKKSSGYVYCR